MIDILDIYGIAAAAAICLIFVFLRKIPFYVIACVATIVVFSWLTRAFVAPQTGKWMVLTLGLLLFSFGMLIVRVMLVRSVSLQLLRNISGANGAVAISEDVAGRLKDMSYFHLISLGERNRLTAFGRFCSTVVVIFYAVFRIK